MNSDMMKPGVFPSVEEIRNMPDDKWLSLVSELAYPQRAATMVKMVRLAAERSVKQIVETGCIRGCAGDGQSTLIFAMLAVRLNASFESFDLNPTHISNAQQWLGSFCEHVTWNTMDSVCGLSRFCNEVGLVYLDSYDYDATRPRACQLHQLAEVGAIYGKLTEHAVIAMDDANLDGGGKVAMAVDFLKDKGWKEYAKGYQIILQR